MGTTTMLLVDLPQSRRYHINFLFSEYRPAVRFSYDGDYLFVYYIDQKKGYLYKFNQFDVTLVDSFSNYSRDYYYYVFFRYPWLSGTISETTAFRIDLRNLETRFYTYPDSNLPTPPFIDEEVSEYCGLDFLDVNRLLFKFSDRIALLDVSGPSKWISSVSYRQLFDDSPNLNLYYWGVVYTDDNYVVFDHCYLRNQYQIRVWDLRTSKVFGLQIADLGFSFPRRLVKIEDNRLKFFLFDPRKRDVSVGDSGYLLYTGCKPLYGDIELNPSDFSDTLNVHEITVSKYVDFYDILDIDPDVASTSRYFFAGSEETAHFHYKTSFTHLVDVGHKSTFWLFYVPSKYRLNDCEEHPILGLDLVLK